MGVRAIPMKRLILPLLVLLLSPLLVAQGRLDRYALLLEDPPLRMRPLAGKASQPRMARANLERRIEAAQQDGTVTSAISAKQTASALLGLLLGLRVLSRFCPDETTMNAIADQAEQLLK